MSQVTFLKTQNQALQVLIILCSLVFIFLLVRKPRVISSSYYIVPEKDAAKEQTEVGKTENTKRDTNTQPREPKSQPIKPPKKTKPLSDKPKKL